MKKYTVWSLDVWGHGSEDCAEYDCPCVDADTRAHDDGACQCGFDVNDRCRVGTVELEDSATDAEILATLDAENFIHETLCELEDYSDGTFLEVNSKKNGRPLISLELEE